VLSTVEAARRLLAAGEPTSVAVAELMAWRDLRRTDAELIVRAVARDLGIATAVVTPSTRRRTTRRWRDVRRSRVAVRLL
jgi:hypothetical protein